jgi:hypothetical protein
MGGTPAAREVTRYCIKFFIVWPPPHSTWKGLKRKDRGMWYWDRRLKTWSRDRNYGFSYDTKAEAENDILIAATAITDLTPGGEQIGSVRISRQLVPLVRVGMSDL